MEFRAGYNAKIENMPQLDGEDYVPELTADGKAEAETVTQSAENDPKTQVRTMAPAVLSGAAFVIVLEALAFGIYRKKKGRRLR